MIETGSGSQDITSLCSESTATILANTECTVSMNSLTAAPYSLSRGDLIEVSISATNSLGTSAYSATSTGAAYAQTVPVAPASAPTEDPTSDENNLVINYSQLTGTDTGDSTITEYQLVWDNGSGSFATTLAVV